MPRLALGLGMGLLVAAARSLGHARRRASREEGGTLAVGTPAFDFIDPALVTPPSVRNPYPIAVWAVADATCGPLLRYPVSPPPVRYSLVPEVATGFPAPSRDGKTYTFTIRKGFRFSTGAAVTAANYKTRFRAMLNPATNSPAAQYLQDVVGVKAVLRGAARTAAGVKVAGNQLIVRLTKRAPDFPARMTMAYLCPVPTDLPIDTGGRRGAAPRLRPLLRCRVRARQPRRPEAEPLLPRLEASSPRPDRRPDRRPLCDDWDKVEAGQLDVASPCPAPLKPASLRGSASTSSSSSRSARSTCSTRS